MTTMRHTAQERCDRCQAQGYTTWGFRALFLTFCGHHTNKYAENLVAQGFTIRVDDTLALHER